MTDELSVSRTDTIRHSMVGDTQTNPQLCSVYDVTNGYLRSEAETEAMGPHILLAHSFPHKLPKALKKTGDASKKLNGIPKRVPFCIKSTKCDLANIIQ